MSNIKLKLEINHALTFHVMKIQSDTKFKDQERILKIKFSARYVLKQFHFKNNTKIMEKKTSQNVLINGGLIY